MRSFDFFPVYYNRLEAHVRVDVVVVLFCFVLFCFGLVCFKLQSKC